jgi:hypothetical protein
MEAAIVKRGSTTQLFRNSNDTCVSVACLDFVYYLSGLKLGRAPPPLPLSRNRSETIVHKDDPFHSDDVAYSATDSGMNRFSASQGRKRPPPPPLRTRERMKNETKVKNEVEVGSVRQADGSSVRIEQDVTENKLDVRCGTCHEKVDNGEETFSVGGVVFHLAHFQHVLPLTGCVQCCCV